MDCASIPNANVLLSISSGSHTYASSKLMESQHDKLQALLRQPWKSICITGFTEEEAKLYIASEGFKHKFEQIKDISGTNPLLLSLLRKDDKIAEYRARILMEEEDFYTGILIFQENERMVLKHF